MTFKLPPPPPSKDSRFDQWMALVWKYLTNLTGTVTSVTAGTGLSGGTITTSGTIALDSSALSGLVPYTGAASNVDLGAHSAAAEGMLNKQQVDSGVTLTISSGYGMNVVGNFTAVGDLVVNGDFTVIPSTPSEAQFTSVIATSFAGPLTGNALTSTLATTATTATDAVTKTGTGSTYVTNAAPTINQANLVGTTTNNSASAGSVGEYIESVVSISFPAATGAWGDATSISLTAGDWNVTAVAQASNNAATVTNWSIGISTTSGNSSSGLVGGSNYVTSFPPITADNASACIANYRVLLAGTTTYYFKLFGSYAAGTPNFAGRLSARRIR